MAPKLILADLDGTLLDEEKHLTPRSRAALERAAAAGCQVVIATGRFFGGVPDFLKELPFLRYFILMNGAKVYDRQTDTVLYRSEIPLDTAQAVYRLMDGLGCTVDCYQNDRGIMPRNYLDHLEHYIPDTVVRMIIACRWTTCPPPWPRAGTRCRRCSSFSPTWRCGLRP